MVVATSTRSRWSLLIFSLSLFSMIPISTSDPTLVGHSCSDTTFTPNSKYQTNLNTVFQSLSSTDATSNRTGFFSTTAGNASSSAVYGLFLCFGDQNSTSCHDCVSTATGSDLPDTYCPNSKEAVIWYDECVVRYSNESLLGKMNQDPWTMIMDGLNIDGNRTRFTELVRDTMSGLAVQAVTRKDRFGRKLATKVVNFTSSEMIYALEQCTPDLSDGDCEQCLRTASGKLMLTKKGSQSSLPSCTVKFYTSTLVNAGNSNSTGAGTAIITGDRNKVSAKVITATVASIVIVLLALVIVMYWLIPKKVHKQNVFTFSTGGDFTTIESLHFDLNKLQNVTNNFSEDNILGKGGFGAVYKGTLKNGQEIAVKRLYISSVKGIEEFKNEILLVAKLQHRNLVGLLGFCLERNEKLLVYEYLPNKSLDHFLFDPKKQGQLDWSMRYQIIIGIARGMLYLHEDSQHRVIHRDLKASNILLDEDMNPKIADFGMARIFGMDQTHGNTNRVVGTYGYMSPEYAMHGQFSVKLEVYSFGVLVLEIISGRMISDFTQSYVGGLLSYAWQKWRDEKPLEFVDETIRDSCIKNEVMRCIHIGLLCVQHSKDDRPTMAEVMQMFDNYSAPLLVPEEPSFYIQRSIESISDRSTNNFIVLSTNDVSITNIEAR